MNDKGFIFILQLWLLLMGEFLWVRRYYWGHLWVELHSLISRSRQLWSYATTEIINDVD